MGGTKDTVKEAESQMNSCPRRLGGDLILTPHMKAGAWCLRELRYKVICFLLEAALSLPPSWDLQLACFSSTRSPGLLCFPKVLSSTCSALCHHVLFLRTISQAVVGVRVSGVLASLNLSSLINKTCLWRGWAMTQFMDLLIRFTKCHSM